MSQEPAKRAWMGRRAERAVAALGLLAALAMLGGCDEAPTGAVPAPITYTVLFGGLGDTPGRYAYPRCLGHDASALWVIDKSARVQRIDPKTGECLALFHMPEWELGKPTGFSVAPGPDKEGKWHDTLLWIADTHYHRVMVYSPEMTTPEGETHTPEPVYTWGSYGNGPGQFYYCTDVAVTYKRVDQQPDRQAGSTSAAGPTPSPTVGPHVDGQSAIDRIYVSEYGGNDRISVFNAAHEFLFSFGHEGLRTDPTAIEFNRPQSMAIRSKPDGSKELVVTDACNHRLGRFTLDGKLIGWVGKAGDQGRKPGQFMYPYGLVVLPDGTAMVSEFGGARVQRIDLDKGTSLGCWGEPGREPGQLAAPWAITMMNDTVYVLDSGNNRVVGFPRPR